MLSFAIGFLKVIAMGIAPTNRVIQADVAGPAGGDDQDGGEAAAAQPVFGALGIIARGRPQTAAGAVEGVGLRTGDGIAPFALRDPRISAQYPNPKEGAVALVGYGGAFDSNEATFDGTGNKTPTPGNPDATDGTGAIKSSVRTIYVPYAFVDGVPTKAHVIVVDGTQGNESIAIVHGEGQSIVLTKDKEIIASINAGTWMKMADKEFSVQADAINLIGTVAIGNPTLALPLLAGVASQPSTRLKITTP
jgi:hypothetical protein